MIAVQYLLVDVTMKKSSSMVKTGFHVYESQIMVSVFDFENKSLPSGVNANV
jgi:hypothetical protein